jgi:hypothetical protein
MNMSVIQYLINNIKIVLILLSISFQVCAIENMDKLLLEAVLDENTKQITLLLEKGANPNSTEALFKKRTIMGLSLDHRFWRSMPSCSISFAITTPCTRS